MSDTWTWRVARDYNGTLGWYITELASEDRSRDFEDKFDGRIETYCRPAGTHWDGSKLDRDEVDAVKRQPFDL